MSTHPTAEKAAQGVVDYIEDVFFDTCTSDEPGLYMADKTQAKIAAIIEAAIDEATAEKQERIGELEKGIDV